MRTQNYRNGSVLLPLLVALIILAALGIGMLAVAYEVRYRAARLKSEAVAMLAAEAGYEKAIFWMSQQPDMLVALSQSAPAGSLSFPDSTGSYQVQFATFLDYRPVFEITAQGQSGIFTKTIST